MRRTVGPQALLLGLLCWLAAAAGGVPQARAESSLSYANFDAWLQACSRLPSNRALAGRMPPADRLPLPKFAALSEVIGSFFDQCRTGALAQTGAWVDEAPRKDVFFDTQRSYFVRPALPFQPFAQKLVVPEGSEIVLRGDLHGDIHSLNAMLQWLNRERYLTNFTVARTNVYLVFLGDYTDRGSYGIEVLHTVLRLKLANPERVFLVRGNHEDVSLAAQYGFLAEGKAKYGASFDAIKVCRLYDFLPVVLYLGCGTDFVQCCHGGMEPGYWPAALLTAPGDLRWQLLGQLRQRRLLGAQPGDHDRLEGAAQIAAQRYWQDFLPASPTTPHLIGFLWNDFTQVRGQAPLELDPGRGFVYGENAARFVLAQAGGGSHRVRAVFRAHQHSSLLNPMMSRLVASRGVFRHWQETDSPSLLHASVTSLRPRLDRAEERAVPDGSVWTFNVAPDSAYGAGCNFAFDAFGILRVGREFKDWKLRVINAPAAP